MKHVYQLLLLAVFAMCSSALWAQDYKYNVVTGEGINSVYFKVYPNDDPDKRYAEVVEGPYQYQGIVTIPDFVTKDDIEYPVTTITTNCFRNCKKLQQVQLGDNVKVIQASAFYFSGDASGLLDFKGNKRNGIIVNLDAPSLTTIASGAFACTSITPEDGVLRIGKNVTSLNSDNGSFMSWATVYAEKVEVAEGNKNYTTDSYGILYDKDITKLVLFPYYAGGINYTTPSTLKRLLSHSMNALGSSLLSFTDSGSLVYVGSNGWGSTTNISLGKNVTSFGDYYRITGTTKSNLTIDSENKTFRVITDANGNKAIYKLDSAGNPVTLCKAFQKNGYKGGKADYNMDGNFGTETFILPTTVTSIASLAFYACDYLKYVDCQNSTVLTAEKIDNNSAPAPVSIKYINISLYAEREGEEGIEYTKDMKKLVNWSSEAKIVDYVMPEEVTSIAGSGMHDNQYAKTFDIGPNLTLGTNDAYFWRLKNLQKFTNTRNNSNGLFVDGDALYKKVGDVIYMESYPSGKRSMIYTVADGTQYLSGTTGTPQVRSFNSNPYLRAVDLGDDMKEMRSRSMYNMTNLAVVKLSASPVPVASNATFEGTASAKTQKWLCVPKDLIDIYSKNSVFNTCFKFFDEESKYDELIRQIEVEYNIEHLKQNLDDDDYSSTVQPGIIGNLLGKTKAENYVYTGSAIKGFHVAKVEDITLEEDGVPAKIYYDRDLYTVTWKNGETVVEEGTERYQKPLTTPDASKVTAPAGKSFFGWHTDQESTVALSFDEAVYEDNVTYYALFADNATVKYTVKHLLQNVGDNNYTEDAAARTEGEGAWGTKTNASARTFIGFTAKAFEQATIAEDGSTVVEIKYDRNNYTVIWMNGSTKISSGTKRYGAALTEPTAPTAAAGKHFVGWNTDKNAQASITIPSQYEADATYYAIYVDNATVAYTVQHKQQNVAGTAYELKETEVGHGIAGKQTIAQANTYTGFTAQAVTQQTIAEDGKTVVEIKYDRNKYDVVWKNGTTTVSSGKLAYGAAVKAPTSPSAVAGKHFAGWNTDQSATGVLNLSGVTVEGAVTYYAIFLDNATVDYTVNHKTQKLDGTYELKAQSTGKGVAGLKTNATANAYDGFTAQTFDQKVIAEDGSTVVDVLYTRNSYELKYDNLQDATIKNSSTYTKAGGVKFEAAIVVPTLSRTGYSYQWSSIPPTTMPSEPVTLTVVWNANTYHDYWDFNDGKNGSVTGDTKYGATIVKPDAVLSKEGYDFVGWARKETPTVVIEHDAFGTMPAKDVYFIAVWKAKSFNYTVKHTFESLDGTFVENVTLKETKATTYGSPSEAVAKSITGFTAQTIEQKTITGDGITVEVKYSRNSYILTWVNSKSDATITNADIYTKTGSTKYGAAIVAPEYTLKGYTYTWNTTIPSTMPADASTYTVNWNANGYTVSIATVEGGVVTADKKDVIVDDVVVLTIKPDAGYEFVNMTTTSGTLTINADKKSATLVMDAANATLTPQFQKVNYKVSVDESISNGTVTPSKGTAQINDVISVETNAADGYELGSLMLTDGTEIKGGSFKMPAKDVTITATFTAKNYNISVASGVEGCDKVTVASSAPFGSTVTISSITAKDGYKLVSVTTDKVKVEKAGGKYSFTMPASDVVITPTFEKVVYDITVETADGGQVTASATTATMGETISFSIEANEGWKLKSLTSEETSIIVAGDKLTATMIMPAKSVAVTPVFEKVDYKITVGTIANGTLTVSGGKTIAQVGDLVKVAYEPKAGYHFTAFLVNGETYVLTDNKFVMPAKDVTISATFSATGYGITIETVEGGSVTAEKTNDVNVDEEIALTISADEGYEFVGMTTTSGSITVADDKKSAKLTMGADNATVVPSFKKIDYILSFTANDGNVVEAYVGSDKVEKANIGDDITLVFKPKKGYEYSSIDAQGVELTMIENGAKFKMPAKSVTGSVVFSKKSYNITLFPTTNGTVVAPEKATYDDPVTLEITPNKGYAATIEVDAVDGDNRFAIACTDGTFTMPSANVEITVNFAAIGYSITYVTAEHGNVSGVATANYNQSVTVTVTPDKGYKLNTITASEGTVVASEDGLSATLTMPDKATIVTATFVAIDYNITYNEAEHGKISGATKANYKDNVIVTIEPDEYYEILTLSATSGEVKISDDKTSATLTMDAVDETLSATFVKKQYPIQIHVTGQGELIAAQSTAAVGDKVEITIKPAEGYSLDGDPVVAGASWVYAEDKQSFTITVEDDNVVVNANFTESIYEVTTVTDAHSTINVNSSAKYQEQVDFEVIPAAGYEVEKVSVDGVDLTLAQDNKYSIVMPAKSIEIKASTKAIAYKIKVGEVENGTIEPDRLIAYVGDKVQVTIEASEGFHLVNLYVNGKGTALAEDNTFEMPAEDVELTARFSEEDYYGITVAKSEGGTVELSKDEAKAGEVVDLVIVPDDGYEFALLTLADGQIGKISDVDKEALTAKLTMAAENATIVPLFKKKEYAIQLTTTESNTIEVVSSASYGDKVTVTFKADKGYKFSNINSEDVEFAVAADGGSATFTMPAKDVKGTVEFVKIDYTILYADAENGAVSGVLTANYGDVVTIDIKPAEHYELSSLKTANGSKIEIAEDKKSAKLTMEATNEIVRATFAKALYPITLKESEKGTIEADKKEAGLGDKVTVVVKPADGYVLGGIAINGKSQEGVANGTLTFEMPAEAVEVEAIYTNTLYAILLKETNNGTLESDKSEASVGDKVTLTVNPARGYQLESVTINGIAQEGIEDGTLVFNMPASKVEVEAIFAKILYSITLKESENGTFVTDKSEAGLGDEVTVTATPDEGYVVEIVKVNGENLKLIDDEAIAFSMPEKDVEVEVIFAKAACNYYQSAKAVSYYSWLLVVDKNDLEAKGEKVEESMVTWYKVVGDLDDPCDDNALMDDEPVKTGFYFTSDTNLKGSGDYYAVIKTASSRYRTEVFYFADKKSPISLAPTRAYRGQTLKVKGLADEATIAVYDINGRLLRVINTDGTETYDLQAEDNSGMYIVNIITDGEERSIKYIVK